MKELDDLEAQAKQNTDVENSAAVMLQKLGDLMIANKDNPARVAQIGTNLKTSGEALAAAIVAVTPTDTGPPPAGTKRKG